MKTKDPTYTAPTPVESSNALVNQFFHSIDPVEKKVHWQGVVVGNPEPGWYLIQLFEWLMGGPSNRALVRIEDMKGWLFYGSAEEMQFSYEHGVAKPSGMYGGAAKKKEVAA